MKPLVSRPAEPPRTELRPGVATRLWTSLTSPLGDLLLCGDGEALTGLYLLPHRAVSGPIPAWRHDAGPFRPVIGQLQAYFAGERRAFDLAVAPQGTSFQRAVWQALLEIPYGETRAYGEVARRIDCPGGGRAVGLANARNPLSIVVPCHRVVGQDGSLTGYASGLERKRWLLSHEARHRVGPV